MSWGKKERERETHRERQRQSEGDREGEREIRRNPATCNSSLSIIEFENFYFKRFSQEIKKLVIYFQTTKRTTINRTFQSKTRSKSIEDEEAN